MPKPVTITIKELTRTSSSNDKKLILQRDDSPLLREILQATYDPFKKYGIKKFTRPAKFGSETMETYWPQLQLLFTSLVNGHGDQGLKNAVYTVQQMLKPDDAELLERILKKDLKAGITATTVNKVFPDLIPVFGIMKAATFKDELWRPDDMGSVKIDGYRCLCRGGQLLSSGGFPIVGADHIAKELEGLGDFDGEIKDPDTEFNEGGGDIRSARVTPNAKFFVFDYLNSDIFKYRYMALETLAKERGWSTSLSKPTTITLLRHRTFTGIEEMKHIYEKALYAGYEGLVLKDPEGRYELKRSKAWLKVKQVLDEDCPIIGFFEGEGKYAGMLGGVIVQRKNGYRSKVGGGFSDSLRSYIWNHQAVYLGRHIEVHYQEDMPSGDFRQARFKKFRFDKD